MKKQFSALANNLRLWFRFGCRRLGVSAYQIHQIVLSDEHLIYIPIPKNACSTIKHALYEIEFDRSFDYDTHQEWGYRDIHDYYKKRSHAFTSPKKLKSQNKSTVFTVIRDPVKRMISCYRNRIVDLKDLEKTRGALTKKGLPLEPDLNTFVLNLEEYRNVNKIVEHHSRPQTDFLGHSLAYIHKIFPIREMESVKRMLRTFKPELTMRAEKSDGTTFELRDLSPEALDKAITFYEGDYQLLCEYYTPEDIRKEYEKQGPS